MNCYMCDSTGRPVAAIAICHHCGVALCRDHLDEDLLSSRPHGHAKAWVHPPPSWRGHGASPGSPADRRFPGNRPGQPVQRARERKPLTVRTTSPLLCGRLIAKGGDAVTLRTCYLVAVACHARLRTRAPLGVLIVEDPHFSRSPGALSLSCLPFYLLPQGLVTCGLRCWRVIEPAAPHRAQQSLRSPPQRWRQLLASCEQRRWPRQRPNRPSEGLYVFWCFHCYARNEHPNGPCSTCGEPVEAPASLSYVDSLIWALRHPDGDRALIWQRGLLAGCGHMRVFRRCTRRWRLEPISTYEQKPSAASSRSREWSHCACGWMR